MPVGVWSGPSVLGASPMHRRLLPLLLLGAAHNFAALGGRGPLVPRLHERQAQRVQLLLVRQRLGRKQLAQPGLPRKLGHLRVCARARACMLCVAGVRRGPGAWPGARVCCRRAKPPRWPPHTPTHAPPRPAGCPPEAQSWGCCSCCASPPACWCCGCPRAAQRVLAGRRWARMAAQSCRMPCTRGAACTHLQVALVPLCHRVALRKDGHVLARGRDGIVLGQQLLHVLRGGSAGSAAL